MEVIWKLKIDTNVEDYKNEKMFRDVLRETDIDKMTEFLKTKKVVIDDTFTDEKIKFFYVWYKTKKLTMKIICAKIQKYFEDNQMLQVIDS